MQVGDRVGAFQSATEKTVRMFGYGEFKGDLVELNGVRNPIAEVTKVDVPNPCILLDDGKIVWGCECWWGAEQKVKDFCSGKEILSPEPPEDIDIVDGQQG